MLAESMASADLGFVTTKANLPIEKYLEIAKDGKAPSYLQLSGDGVFVHTPYQKNSASVHVFLGKNEFDITGPPLVAVSGMFVIADMLKRMNAFRSRITKYVAIHHTPGQHYIALSILDHTKETLTTTRFTARPVPDNIIPTRTHKHEVMLELLSQDLLMALEGMPPVFSVRVDREGKKIEFKGTGQFDTTTVCNIPLSDAACVELKKYSGTMAFQEHFNRPAMLPLMRTCRLTQSVFMGVTQNVPTVFHAYLSDDSHPLVPNEPRSHVQITVFPHIDTVAKLNSRKNSRKRPCPVDGD